MLKTPIGICFMFSLISCGQGSSFFGEGKSKSQSKATIHQQNAVVEEVLDVGETIADLDQMMGDEGEAVVAKDENEILVIKEAELALEKAVEPGSCKILDLEQNVVLVEDNDADLSQLTADSIVVVRPRGNAELDLKIASDSIASIMGLCIDSRGGSEIEMEINLTVKHFSYYGRGGGESELKFSSDDLLSFANILDIDINGDHELEMTGVKLECEGVKKSDVENQKLECVEIK